MRKLTYSLVAELWHHPCNSKSSLPCKSSPLAEATTHSAQSFHQNSPWIWRNYNQSKQHCWQGMGWANVHAMKNPVGILSFGSLPSFSTMKFTQITFQHRISVLFCCYLQQRGVQQQIARTCLLCSFLDLKQTFEGESHWNHELCLASSLSSMRPPVLQAVWTSTLQNDWGCTTYATQRESWEVLRCSLFGLWGLCIFLGTEETQ